MGLPVVAYRHGGIVESMLEDQTGLLAEENDILGFLDDDEFWDRCSRAGAVGEERV